MDDYVFMNQPPGFHGSTNDQALVHKLHTPFCQALNKRTRLGLICNAVLFLLWVF